MMRINGTITRIGSYVALFPLAYGMWWFTGHVAQASDAADERVEMQQAIKAVADGMVVLKAIHVKLDTEEEARAALIDELCRHGKLAKTECPGRQWTPVPQPVVVPE